MFSNEIKEVLKESGWYEGRKIAVSEYIDRLKYCGFQVFDLVPTFLEEFDKLRVMYLHRYKNYNPERRECGSYFES